MDGQNRSIVVNSGIYYPNGLALDLTRNWLYWIDWNYEKLEVYEFPTNTRREIISSYEQAFLYFPFGLALHQNYLFWTERHFNGIYRADRETGANVVKVLSTQSSPYLIHAYDRNTTIIPGISNCVCIYFQIVIKSHQMKYIWYLIIDLILRLPHNINFLPGSNFSDFSIFPSCTKLKSRRKKLSSKKSPQILTPFNPLCFCSAKLRYLYNVGPNKNF